ncbi:YoaK family protein [Microbacterium sp. SLBN-146]|uniref:YoaK family protein n=1 Tax=Microbacterium sp. SLBN-146 TaxID=2768457 RepID=UPI001151E3BE|nr:YoaK family protein [Microbacterium sp. SLBN-146]TQJ30005.1 uncharacterized membrane protein YoaK (UPF0700 family) [Microbacterium sp. SLBN-146]
MSAVSTHPRRARFPLLERPVPAVLFAVIAGLLNSWTFANTQTFATVQSGNIVSLGLYLVQGEWPRVAVALVSVVAFFTGACLCSLLVLRLTRHGGSYSVAVLSGEALVLIAATILLSCAPIDPWWIAWGISFLAGVQGNAFHRESGMLYGNVAVTLVVQMAGSLLGRAIGHRIASDGQPHLRPAGAYVLVLLGFASGGGIGFALDEVWSTASILSAAVLLLGLAVLALQHDGAVDPAQNAPTP